MASEVDNLEDIYELSPMQRGMLFHTLYAPRSGVYIEQIILSLQGPLDFGAFYEAWQRVVAQHATLRTAFLWEELDEPMQVVYRTAQIPWKRHDWRELTPAAQQARLEELLAADRARGFDLASPPLLRMVLLHIANDTHYLLLTHHHLLLDGWSLNIVLQEALSAYKTLRTGGEPHFRARRPYRDYISWLRHQSLREGEAFWRNSLQGFIAPTPLLLEGLGNAHVPAQEGRGASSASQERAPDAGQNRELHLRGGRPVELRGFKFSRETTVALGTFARQHQLTLNTLVQGAWALLLSRYNFGADRSADATTDVVFGATVAGRPAGLPGAEDMVGLFINTLPVRVRVDARANLLSWLAQLQKEQAEARQYDFTPLVQVHGWSEVPRDQPLFESLVVFENYRVEEWESSDEEESGKLRVHALQALEQTNYPLVLIVEPGAELEIQFGYETARFTPEAIRRALLFLRTLLEAFMAHPHMRLAEISLLDESERLRLVSRWQRAESESAYPQDVTLIHLFQEQVLRTPEALALFFPGRENDALPLPCALTYAELERRANQLARYLRGLGVGAEVRVGLYMERSLDLAIAFLGILKAGGTAVPLDSGYPEERLAAILADAQADQSSASHSPDGSEATLYRSDEAPPLVVLTQHRLATRLPATPARIICIESEWAAIERESGDPPRVTILPANAAYILYTSGSTGVPKGVVVAHQSLANHCSVVGERYALQAGDRVLQFASPGFDVAMEELLPTWLRGATVVMWPEIIAPAPAAFSRFVAAEQLTVLNLPSSYWHAWVSELARPGALRPTSVRLVIVGSEKVLAAHVHTWQEIMGNGLSLYNAYGLTETTVTSLLYAVPHASAEEQSTSVPIGQAIAHTQAYVLDTQLAPVPVGMPGELYIGGAGLARGYLHRPDLTAERFVPHPLSSIPGARLYRTGDLVRSREDGTLEFLGRVDTQVKVRGFRVELGEIEHCISQHAAVSDVVVLAREDTPNDIRLVAYILPARRNAPPNLPVQLRAYLQDRLPPYMVPAAFVILDSFPRTSSGKVDRRTLPAPERVHARAGEDYIPPRTPLEEILAGVWAVVLHLEHVGRLDNFFKLGGHSLQATQVVARLREILRIELPVRALYDTPTIHALASFLEKSERSAIRQVPIQRVDRDSTLPLSFAQQRLWFLDQLQPDSPLYNVPGSFSISGALDVMALEQSLNVLVQRHEPLRTTFAVRNGQPVQIIAPALYFPLPLVDLSHIADNTTREAEVLRLVREEAQRPFSLQCGPLIRAALLRLSLREHVLLLTLHHIVADGWSAEIFFEELNASYAACITGVPAQLPDLPIQYADYAAWQQEWLQGEILERQLIYWRQQLAGLPPVLDLPIDHPRPAVRSFSGGRYSFHLPSSLTAQLRMLSQQEGVTLFMILLAALQTLLSRYSGQSDIAIGTPIAGRTHLEVERLIGFFVNTLVLRSDLSDNPTFIELLSRVREMTLAAYTHQDLPFEKLVEELQPERSLNQSPLFQVLFVLQNAWSDSTGPGLPSRGLKLKPLETGSGTAKFDLSFELLETPLGLEGYIEYSTDLFDASTIRRMAGHYATLLAGIASDPEQRIAGLPLLSDAERRQILEEWSDPDPCSPQTMCLPALFEDQVARTPDRVAVVLGDHQLTYGELNVRANRLAHLLQRLGVRPEVCVGLLCERSLEQLISLLAILKAGGAYVPLDPDYPSQRLAFLLRDAHITILLTQQSLLSRLSAPQPPQLLVVCLETLEAALQTESCENLALPLSSQQLAYIIYTSGSTGQPKGVMIAHQQVASLLVATGSWLLGDEPETWTLFHSVAFDFSVWEIWGAWLSGGRLVVVPYWQSRSPGAFLHLLGEQRVSVLNQTPSAFWQLSSTLKAEDVPPELWVRHVLFGGEALDVPHLQSWWEQLAAAETQLVNLYGITETTVHVSWYRLRFNERAELDGSPIGRPLPGWQVYLLDAAGQPVPAGVPGEIYVGGAGVARGYLGRPELSAERFVPHPWSAQPGERLYRSGDLARWRPDGQLVYLGRNDRQVKLRGFRLELGELEASLQEHRGVRQAVATMWEDSAGEQQLVAYVVTEPGQAPAVADLRAFLSTRLPGYMLPATIVFLEELPLTPHGKLDRRALPDPDSGKRARGDISAPARTLMEEVLIAIWSDILHIDQVGTQDNFFDLGGHSLLATRMIARVREAYKVDIPLRTVFEAPTLAALAARIEAARGGAPMTGEILPLTPRPEGTTPPLSYAQERLWFLHELEPESSAYNISVELQVRGDLNRKALQESLDALIQRHETLRTTFSVAGGVPRQVIAPSLHVDLPERDLNTAPAEIRQQELQQEAKQEILRPFDLSRGPLLRALLLRLDEEEHILLLTLHHSIADGWSTGILVNELNSLYSAAAAGESPSLPALPIQYADYAFWQRQWLQGERLERQVAYWREQLKDAPGVLDLPTDYPRPATSTYRGGACFFGLSPTLSQQLLALSRREAVTLFMILLAAFEVLLLRYSGQTDIVVGTPIAGRTSSETEGLIGLFVNTLALRVNLAGNPSFRALLERVREVCLEAYTHQDIPFSKVVEAVQPERSLSRPPLFQVMFAMQNAPLGGQILSSEGSENAALRPYPLALDEAATKFDLTVEFMNEQEGLQGNVEYNADLFEQNTIERFIRHFQKLLEGIVANPAERLSSLPLLDDAEQRHLLFDWNATDAEGRTDVCVHQLFEEQVARSPDAVALVYQDRRDGESILTYAELNQWADWIAGMLRARGVKTEVVVGLYLERSPAMIAAVLGVLKARGAYLPLDPSHPRERLAFMLHETQAPLVLTQQHLREKFPTYRGTVLCLDDDEVYLPAEGPSSPVSTATAANLAYVIYTSGSTGRPKGVMITHGGLVNYLRWCLSAYRVEQGCGSILHSSLATDLSVTSLFAPLLAGQRLRVLPEEQGLDGLAEALRQERDLSLVKLTPAHLTLLAEQLSEEEAAGRTQTLVIGGEALRREQVVFWQEHASQTRLINEYGPTETVVGCCVYEVAAQERRASIPIGRPITNTRLYLLDQEFQPVPIGVYGELYIAGTGVARGYLRRPDLTAERFLPNPWSSEPGARLYRTGDLARYLPNGNLEFLGRNDSQVKLRGYRIEPGEIEATLKGHPEVQEAVVLLEERQSASAKERHLTAYLVGQHASSLSGGELRAYLRERLPDYMVPAFYVWLESLPLLPNGKVDRHALSAIGQSRTDAKRGSVGETAAARNPVEEALVDIWAQILGRADVGIFDNFFDLGGHSLLITQVISRVREQLQVELPLRALFEHPTIAEFAEAIIQQELEQADGDELRQMLAELEGKK